MRGIFNKLVKVSLINKRGKGFISSSSGRVCMVVDCGKVKVAQDDNVLGNRYKFEECSNESDGVIVCSGRRSVREYYSGSW